VGKFSEGAGLHGEEKKKGCTSRQPAVPAKINLVSAFFRHNFVKKTAYKIAKDWVRQRLTKMQPA